MKKSTIALLVVAVIAVIALANSFYVVREDQVATVMTLGRIKAVVVSNRDVASVQQNLNLIDRADIKIINEKGLHFKVPFIQSVNLYSSKFMTYKSNQTIINTWDDKRIEIQMYAQYRVLDPVRFQLSVGDMTQAGIRMDDVVYKNVVQAANSLVFDDFFDQTAMNNLLTDRRAILNETLLKEYGLFITDIGINRKKFPESNVSSVESKMTLQIQKDSERLIAEGDSFYVQAQAMADREKAEIVALAVEEAAVVSAGADAEAISIIQNSLQKDLSFYQFIKRMEIYREMKGSTVFVDSGSEIFNFLNGYRD